MPSLEELAKNIDNYRYYSGYGTFNANNLPYGKDEPGGGSSRQPFVVRGVDTRWSPSNFDDGLTPFGIVSMVSRTAVDLSRVTQFLYTTTKGPLFLIKQTGLQRINPNIRQLDVENFEKKITPTQLYNPLGLNTLAQVGLGALGARFTKHGLIPQTEEQDDYAKYIKDNDILGINKLQNLLKKLSKSPDDLVLYKYKGGPGSVYGIGNTTLRRYYNTSMRNEVVDLKSGFVSIPVKNLQGITGTSNKSVDVIIGPLTYQEGSTASADDLGTSFLSDLQANTFNLGSTSDFRAYKNALRSKLSESGTVLPTSDYQNYNLEKRIGIATPRTAANKVDYTSTGSIENSDRINLISLYYSNAPVLQKGDILDINNRFVNKETIRDIIKFRIKVYDNDRTLDPKGNNYGVYIIFRAYITNIRRNVTSKWDAYKYVGRGESFYAYDGFSETVTLSFTIAASSRAEMKPLYQKLNYLISTLAPDYSRSGLMRGNISELTVGDFILYQPGIITSLDMIIDEDSNWEIALSEPESLTGGDSDMHELPQIIKCTMSFIPIYNFLPRKSSEAPFIGIDGLSENKEGKQWLRGTNANLNETRTPLPPTQTT